jgi:ferric-dicitrate binding protein FerR (iron transport regulator)
MSTPLPPRHDDPTTGPTYRLPLADEESLRRVFDETFSELVDEARSQLGEARTMAQRVVEGAFVCAWEEREELLGPAQLRSFLSAEVHKGAVRALSRREAAHRMGAHSTPAGATPAGATPLRPQDIASTGETSAAPDAERAWAHVLRSIHHEGHSAEAIAESVQRSRHDAAEHVASISKPAPWKPIAAVAAIALVAVVLGSRWIGVAGEGARVSRAINAPDVRIVSSMPGRGAVVTLNEGTRVTLAPDSKLSIPKDFSPTLRAVKLEGAGTFEPKTGEAQPLQVFVRNAVVSSTGGAFNARGWADDGAASVRARGPGVTLTANEQAQPLAAGQSVAVAGDGATRALDGDALVATMAWTDDSLVVVNQPLRAVLPVLTRWYGLDLKVPDGALLDRPVTFRAPLNSSRLAVEGIERSGNVRYSYAGQDLALRDVNDPAARRP